MIKQAYLFVLLLICAFSSPKGFAQENGLVLDVMDNLSSVCEKQVENRLYLKPGVVLISANEIFVLANDNLIQVNTLYSDASGLYLNLEEINPEAWDGACPNGHTNLCPLCRGCLNFCRYRCTCYR